MFKKIGLLVFFFFFFVCVCVEKSKHIWYFRYLKYLRDFLPLRVVSQSCTSNLKCAIE